MKRNWARGLIGGLSFTSALFIFQACYGMPQDMMNDLLLEGKVTSSTTGLPVEGIRVSLEEWENHVITDSEGDFSFYTLRTNRIRILCEDPDPYAHGHFASKDTLLTDPGDEVYVNIALEEY